MKRNLWEKEEKKLLKQRGKGKNMNMKKLNWSLLWWYSYALLSTDCGNDRRIHSAINCAHAQWGPLYRLVDSLVFIYLMISNILIWYDAIEKRKFLNFFELIKKIVKNKKIQKIWKTTIIHRQTEAINGEVGKMKMSLYFLLIEWKEQKYLAVKTIH